ncbi:MAG: hypothetical protein HQM03_20585 [Magnetococcales bacterium]|nr:hypothetical protein [Magnetococcales bacterium]
MPIHWFKMDKDANVTVRMLTKATRVVHKKRKSDQKQFEGLDTKRRLAMSAQATGKITGMCRRPDRISKETDAGIPADINDQNACLDHAP